MAGWRAAGWRDGWSENAVRLARFDVVCRFARFAVFAVHRGGRFLAVRFRFAVRFTAFLAIGMCGACNMTSVIFFFLSC